MLYIFICVVTVVIGTREDLLFIVKQIFECVEND